MRYLWIITAFIAALLVGACDEVQIIPPLSYGFTIVRDITSDNGRIAQVIVRGVACDTPAVRSENSTPWIVRSNDRILKLGTTSFTHVLERDYDKALRDFAEAQGELYIEVVRRSSPNKTDYLRGWVKPVKLEGPFVVNPADCPEVKS